MTPIEILLAKPIVPVFYHSDLEVCKSVIHASHRAGVRLFKFTNRGENAAALFEELVKYVKVECPELLLGMGTVKNATSAQQFIDMGADFIVQPFTTPEVGEVCAKNNIPWIPGAMTVTEIQNAVNLGAEIVKIFPANILTPAFVKAVRGPLPEVKLMASGGIDVNEYTVNQWFAAGVNIVALGSQLFKNLDNPREITQSLRILLKHFNHD